MSDYKYLFPFEKVPKNSSVIIYGGGEVGWEYLRQLLITKFAKVVGIVDRRAGSITGMPVEVFSPAEIPNLKFDYVVLAFKSGAYYKTVLYDLKKMGVDESKIVYIPPRVEPSYILITGDEELIESETTYSYNMDCLSIAVKLGSAIGDNIFQKKFIKALADMDPKVKIDIFSPVSTSYLPWLYRDCPNINAFIQDGGELYARHRSHYDLSLQIWLLVNIDSINEQKLRTEHVEFYKKVKKLQSKIKATDMTYNMPMHNYVARAIKQGKNAYTVYDYDGEFGITDNRVDIILDDEYKGKYEDLKLPSKYCTVNYGNGITAENAKLIAKQWPSAYFEELIKKIKKYYPEISVVQLGEKNSYHLCGADRYILGKPLGVVAHVLNNSLLHIDIDGGLVHMATQLGTKCAVLFGPTQEEFFGYEQNINIKAGTCHDCCGMYLDHTICARHLDEPECMYSISSEMVMDKIKGYLDEHG